MSCSEPCGWCSLHFQDLVLLTLCCVVYVGVSLKSGGPWGRDLLWVVHQWKAFCEWDKGAHIWVSLEVDVPLCHTECINCSFTSFSGEHLIPSNFYSQLPSFGSRFPALAWSYKTGTLFINPLINQSVNKHLCVVSYVLSTVLTAPLSHQRNKGQYIKPQVRVPQWLIGK